MKHFITLLVSLALLGCSKKETETVQLEAKVKGNEVTLTPQQVKTALIETGYLTNQNIAAKIILNGTIEVPPQAMARVSAPTGGFVRSTRGIEGMYVSRGQSLVTLEDPQIIQLQQDYLLARSNLTYAQKDYARQRDLNQSKAASDKVMQQAQTESQNQSILMHSLAAKLRAIGINPGSVSAGNIRRTINVYAPVSGYISKVNVSIGQYVSPTEQLYDIVNTGNVYLALKVFEKDLGKISAGQRVFAYANQNPEKKYAASIRLIGQDFGPDRSVTVNAYLIDRDAALIPGTFMNAEVETNAEEGFIIPDGAVVTWESRPYIFEAKNATTFSMTPVVTGNSENGYTEILNYNPADQHKKWVTKNAYQLLMAMKNIEE